MTAFNTNTAVKTRQTRKPTVVRPVSELLQLSKLDPEPYITISEALSLIPGMTRNHLAQLRFDNQGPKCYRPTAKCIYYKASEVLNWIANGEAKDETGVSA